MTFSISSEIHLDGSVTMTLESDGPGDPEPWLVRFSDLTYMTSKDIRSATVIYSDDVGVPDYEEQLLEEEDDHEAGEGGG